jgi:GTPase SAR1 family protein
MVDFKIKSELVQSNNKSVKAQVFEASGATQYQNNVAYYRGASVAVFVFDLTNRDSFEHIATWNEKFELERPGIVKMLVGTKSGSVSRTVGKDEALELARQLGMTYWDVDSETSFQVDQMFLDAIDQRIKMDRELEESGVVVGKLPTSQFLILKTSHPHTWTEWIKSWWGN